MQVDISISQLCELLAFDPRQFVGIVRTSDTTVTVTLEDEMAQTTGVIPQLTQGGKKIGGSYGKGGKKGGKRGC